jgi:ectoine hydroxylase-related dioxygenase (phytanoyl-CoA dioxygenase family)
MGESVLAQQYEEFIENGFVVLSAAVSEDLIEKYNNKYSKEDFLNDSPDRTYLPSRQEHKNDIDIRNILTCDTFRDFLKLTGIRHALQISEARYSSSRISWHRDYFGPYTQNPQNPNNYIGVLVCLEDVDHDSGPFEVIPGSHTWDVDESIINSENCSENDTVCYEYYLDMVNEKSIEPFLFEGKSGDAVIWNGLAIHRGSVPKKQQTTRHALVGHFTENSLLSEDVNILKNICEEQNGFLYVIE